MKCGEKDATPRTGIRSEKIINDYRIWSLSYWLMTTQLCHNRAGFSPDFPELGYLQEGVRCIRKSAESFGPLPASQRDGGGGLAARNCTHQNFAPYGESVVAS